MVEFPFSFDAMYGIMQRMMKQMKQLVFIDDSGDPGFTEVSSTNFVMAAALFMDPEVADTLSKQISEYRRSLGWRDDYEFKFAKIRKDVIVDLLKMVINYDFQIYAVHIDKTAFQYVSPIIDKEKLYNWTIKELLNLMPLTNAKIKIDGRSSRQNMYHTATYLRRGINSDRSKKLIIKFEDSVDNNLIQLADIIVGSLGRYINTSKTDYATYIDIIKNKIVQLKHIDQR